MGQNPQLTGGFDASSPGTDLVPVTPDDDNDLTTPAKAVRCKPTGTAGTLRVTTYAGVVRNTTIAAGELLPLAVVRIHDTGTNADGLEALI